MEHANGKVIQKGTCASYGNYLVVKDIENGYYHWFCHLAKTYVIIGERVNRITKIGLMGDTGNATGIHLHYEIRKKSNKYDDTVNPAIYCGIPNKVGKYDSKNFQLEKNDKKEEKQEINNGCFVMFHVELTGAEEGNTLQYQYKDHQGWIYKHDYNNSKKLVKAQVAFIEGDELGVELGTEQIRIDKNDVVEVLNIEKI